MGKRLDGSCVAGLRLLEALRMGTQAVLAAAWPRVLGMSAGKAAPVGLLGQFPDSFYISVTFL